MPDNKWARLLAYVAGLVNQKLLLQNEYLAAENRILRAHLFAMNQLLKAYLFKESLARLWFYGYEGAMLRYLQTWIEHCGGNACGPFKNSP